MSEIVDYIRSAVNSYALREIDIDGFREAFVGAYFYVRNSAFGDEEAQRLASKLMVPVAEFSAGHRTETSLREELVNAIHPLEPKRVDSVEAAPQIPYAIRKPQNITLGHYRVRESARPLHCLGFLRLVVV